MKPGGIVTNGPFVEIKESLARSVDAVKSTGYLGEAFKLARTEAEKRALKKKVDL